VVVDQCVGETHSDRREVLLDRVFLVRLHEIMLARDECTPEPGSENDRSGSAGAVLANPAGGLGSANERAGGLDVIQCAASHDEL